MSYIESINPFDGILCVPYYYLFLPIIFSWLLTWIEVLFVELTSKCSKYILKSHNGLQHKINTKLRRQFRFELEKMSILPNEIILIIMSMLPLTHENWSKYKSKQQRIINTKSNFILIIKYLYPFLSFFAHCINFIIVIIHYTQWMDDHKNETHWNKYCSFIIALLYMPICKGRATMRWFGFPFWYPGAPLNHPSDDPAQTPWVTANFCQMFCEWAFFFIFCIIAAPILIPGAIIFLPTMLLFLCWVTFAFVLIFVAFMDCISEDVGGYCGLVVSLTIGMIFVLTMITVCTMEFFNGSYWTQSYRIGLFGQYCDENDMFSMAKWNENFYSWDQKFLIVSWILF